MFWLNTCTATLTFPASAAPEELKKLNAQKQDSPDISPHHRNL
jgi:hypothetical protein